MTCVNLNLREMELGKTILALRNLRGWSQEKLASMAGVSGQTISNIETGTTKKLQPAQLEKVANSFGMSPLELLNVDKINSNGSVIVNAAFIVEDDDSWVEISGSGAPILMKIFADLTEEKLTLREFGEKFGRLLNSLSGEDLDKVRTSIFTAKTGEEEARLKRSLAAKGIAYHPASRKAAKKKARKGGPRSEE